MPSMVTPAESSSILLATTTPRSLQSLYRKQTLKANAPPRSQRVEIIPTAPAGANISCSQAEGSARISQEFLVTQTVLEAKCAFFNSQGCFFLSMHTFFFGFCILFYYFEKGILSISHVIRQINI